MDELFAKYEHELGNLRSLCREYAQRYPKVAARLQLGGDTCDDPHVERMIQAVALLCARVTKRLDDSYPQFTEALLNLLFPHYLRTFPSCAIARFGDASGTFTQVARGTLLNSAPIGGVACTFTTAYAHHRPRQHFIIDDYDTHALFSAAVGVRRHGDVHTEAVVLPAPMDAGFMFVGARQPLSHIGQADAVAGRGLSALTLADEIGRAHV